MPWFRSPPPQTAGLLTESNLAPLVSELVHPSNFLVVPPLKLDLHSPAEEESFWEMFRGRALDHTQTRNRRRFLSWNVFDRDQTTPGDEPLLSVKWDREARQVHVTRSIRCRSWEAYSDNAGAVLSRANVRRVRELLGTIDLSFINSPELFRDELMALLHLAIVGTSRLSLTSVETPMPEFTFGQFAFCYQENDREASVDNLAAWIDDKLCPNLGENESARLLELALRTGLESERDRIADQFLDRWTAIGRTAAEIIPLLKVVFNSVSLTPYLGLVSAAREFGSRLVANKELTAADLTDFLCHLLRQTTRHLTAYDLVKFHHRGANYPDALLLEEVLRHVLSIAQHQPALFQADISDGAKTSRIKRLRRRGIRQAWLAAHFYHHLRVPNLPTSPGENIRILPLGNVPEEQLTQPNQRQRELFTSDWNEELRSPAIRSVLQQSVADLLEPQEQIELGLGLFLDRPLGYGKFPGEPDRTLLFSYEAFSQNTALDRVRQIGEFFGPLAPSEALSKVRGSLQNDSVKGIPVRQWPLKQRPGVVAFEDALVAADDFVFMRNTRRSIREFRDWYAPPPEDAQRIDALLAPGHCLIVRSPETSSHLLVYDAQLRHAATLTVDLSHGYVARLGIEHPAAGLLLRWANESREIRLRPTVH